MRECKIDNLFIGKFIDSTDHLRLKGGLENVYNEGIISLTINDKVDMDYMHPSIFVSSFDVSVFYPKDIIEDTLNKPSKFYQWVHGYHDKDYDYHNDSDMVEYHFNIILFAGVTEEEIMDKTEEFFEHSTNEYINDRISCCIGQYFYVNDKKNSQMERLLDRTEELKKVFIKL